MKPRSKRLRIIFGGLASVSVASALGLNAQGEFAATEVLAKHDENY